MYLQFLPDRKAGNNYVKFEEKNAGTIDDNGFVFVGGAFRMWKYGW